MGVLKLSKAVNFDESVLYDYLHGTMPSIKFAVILAEHFKCSLNYLLGLEETKKECLLGKEYDLSKFVEKYNN